ncbi:3-deoxy-manno-octulosonate-8-phosphatase KdsC [Teredinibacter turnerae]|uniref:3-deoxy-manno-octulosonate-8-phosphatase KdsC n=1 Tax=Teredinibacter turnerae TaxID=2426 RepID=UPI00036961BA|nr:3-deoxy-manno-octulosonate-8-phosphatase KdsC [Teredinibacter turnerae]
MKHLSLEDIHRKAAQIKLLLLDVDGVMTDGRLYFSNDGQEMKTFNTLDGHGIKMLRRSGVEVGIITGRTSQLVAKRAADLGISLLMQGREDKFTALEEMRATFPCELDQIAFMGDDYPDLTVMCRVGLALTVQNGHPAVVERAHWQSAARGGEGAVREACDLIMQAQGTYDAALQAYLRTQPHA